MPARSLRFKQLAAALLSLALAPHAAFAQAQPADLPAQQMEEVLSPDPQVNRARKHLQAGEHQKALDLLAGRVILQKKTTHRHDTLFLIGLASSRLAEEKLAKDSEDESAQADLDRAILAFRSILIDDPRIYRVRLELAYAFYQKGEDDLATQHFEHVLAAGPPPEMAHNIRRFIGRIKARKRWGGHFSLSIAPSNNINSGTDRRTIYLLGGLPFTINEESRAKSGTGVVISGGASYKRPLTRDWCLLGGIDASRTEYAGHDFDGSSLFARGGVCYAPPAAYSFSAQINAGGSWSARNLQYRAVGLQLRGSYRLDAKTTATAGYSRQQRYYTTDTDSDGAYTSYTVGLHRYLFAAARLQLSSGFTQSRPKNRHSHSNELFHDASLTTLWPFGWELTPGLRDSRSHSRGASAAAGGEQPLTRTRTYRLGVLNQKFTFFGVSPQLSLVREVRESNNVFGNYKKRRAELRFVRQF